MQNIESPLKKLNASSPSTSKASFAADPLSLIQAKADTFDGLDPLSMFAAQEASSNKTAAMATSASVTTKEKVHVHLYMKNIIIIIMVLEAILSGWQPHEK